LADVTHLPTAVDVENAYLRATSITRGFGGTVIYGGDVNGGAYGPSLGIADMWVAIDGRVR
ncbi:MAG TPA: hypothetical protein VIV60_08035, partial [Polyangiaceae bacterium]